MTSPVSRQAARDHEGTDPVLLCVDYYAPATPRRLSALEGHGAGHTTISLAPPGPAHRSLDDYLDEATARHGGPERTLAVVSTCATYCLGAALSTALQATGSTVVCLVGLDPFMPTLSSCGDALDWVCRRLGVPDADHRELTDGLRADPVGFAHRAARVITAATSASLALDPDDPIVEELAGRYVDWLRHLAFCRAAAGRTTTVPRIVITTPGTTGEVTADDFLRLTTDDEQAAATAIAAAVAARAPHTQYRERNCTHRDDHRR